MWYFRDLFFMAGFSFSDISCSCLICIILNYIFIRLFVEHFHLYPTISKMITTAIVVSFSYLTQKNFTFKSHPVERAQSLRPIALKLMLLGIRRGLIIGAFIQAIVCIFISHIIKFSLGPGYFMP